MMHHTRLLSLFLLITSIIIGAAPNHECGIAMVRLLKPLSHYNNPAYGIHTLRLLMEKQRNRGQDSVGISVLQCDMPAGKSYMNRLRATDKNALEHLFWQIDQELNTLAELPENADEMSMKNTCRVVGEAYLGHVRYATYAGRKIKFAQPCMYRNSIPAKCLSLAGNFNMTNSTHIKNEILSYGLAPLTKADTHLIMHQISYWLDKAYEETMHTAFLHRIAADDAAQLASSSPNILSAISAAAKHWDGGYVFGGLIGNGDAFICRDPAGIRPGFYYVDDTIFVAASERSAIMNVLHVSPDQVKEIPPAHILIIRKNGTIAQHEFTAPLEKKACTFERIYFSRSSDPDIYQERKNLGKQLAERVFEELHQDTKHAQFSYIPNTSEISFYGLVQEINKQVLKLSYAQLSDSGAKALSEKEMNQLLKKHISVEKLVFKDQAIRTFIAHDSIRSNLISNVYDVTRGVVSEKDTLLVLDDSIVRGATLRESVIRRLVMLNPKKIIILSAAPIILYPDCYGIDMSQISTLIGFQAAIALTQERGNQNLLDAIYEECNALQKDKKSATYNPIKKLYTQFTQRELEEKIAQLIYPSNSDWHGELRVLYQTIDGLHAAVPHHHGDWYFTGDYPTDGGYRIVIKSFINWYTNNTKRAY